MKLHRFTLIFVICLTMAGQLAGVIYLPSLPPIQSYFQSNEANIKLILILYLLGFGFSQLFFGPYSDQKGRKNALVIGLVLSLVGNFICSVSTSISLLNFSRILVGFGSGSLASVGRAILRDIFQDKNNLIKATSIIGTITSLTPAIGPLIGGFIQEIAGWRYNFLFLTIFTLLGFLLTLFWYKETNVHLLPRKRVLGVFQEFNSLFKNRNFTLSVFCASVAFSGLISYEISAPFLFENILKFTPKSFGLISLLIAGSISLGSLINSKLSQYNAKKRLLFSSGVFIGSGLIFLLSSCFLKLNALVILLPVILFAIGVGVIFPTAIANALFSFKTNVGSASALFGFTQMIFTMIVNYGFSFIELNTGIPLAFSFLVSGLIVFLLAARMNPHSQKIN